MFQWNVEDMALLNQKGGVFIDKEKIYDCERDMSREEKIAFVDNMQDGKLSHILELIEKFEKDKDNLPKDQWGHVKTVSIKAWIKRNDTKYDKPILDDYYYHGSFNLLGIQRYIQTNTKRDHDTYEDLVDEAFHCQLKKCEQMEKKYFLEHDEYSILKTKFKDYMKSYGTTFGVHIITSSNGYIYVGEDFDNKRELSIDELKELISRYEQLDILVKKLTAETHITY